MMRQTDVDFNNSYIGAKWCDFVISPNDNGGYRMNPENIHIWPDKESMMMAQPDVVSYHPTTFLCNFHSVLKIA